MVAPKIKMKAILHKEFGGPEVLGVTNDVEIPQIEKHEVLIQVHAAGINLSLIHISEPTRPY